MRIGKGGIDTQSGALSDSISRVPPYLLVKFTPRFHTRELTALCPMQKNLQQTLVFSKYWGSPDPWGSAISWVWGGLIYGTGWDSNNENIFGIWILPNLYPEGITDPLNTLPIHAFTVFPHSLKASNRLVLIMSIKGHPTTCYLFLPQWKCFFREVPSTLTSNWHHKGICLENMEFV